MQTRTRRPALHDSLAVPISIMLALAVVATRWPLRTQWLFNWDSANFALALRHFDVRLHQPHPPGYFLYVMASRALSSAFGGDANTALTFVSMALSAAAVVALYWLGRSMISETAGRWAALLLLTSVTFWSYGGVALAYPALAAFSALVGLLAYRARFLGEDRLWLLGAVYALGGGFRPDLMLFLAPLVLLAAWGKPLRSIAWGAAATAAVFWTWFAPTVALSGGPAEYWAVFSAYGSTDVIDRYSSTALGASGLAVNVRDTLSYVFYTLYAAALLVPVALVGLALSGRKLAAAGAARPFLGRLGFLLLWASPMLAFYLLIHVGDPGYVFSLLPALLLGIVWGWEAAPLPEGWWRFRPALLWSGVLLAAMLNAGVFFLHDRPLTLPGLRANDAAVAARIELARASDPAATALVSYDSLKHLRYYLPDRPEGVWVDVFGAADRVYGIPDGARELLLVDSSVAQRAAALPGEVIALPNGQQAKRTPLPPGSGRLLVWRAPGPDRPRGALTLAPP